MQPNDPWKAVDPFNIGGDARALLAAQDRAEEERRVKQIEEDSIKAKIIAAKKASELGMSVTDAEALIDAEKERQIEWTRGEHRQRRQAYAW